MAATNMFHGRRCIKVIYIVLSLVVGAHSVQGRLELGPLPRKGTMFAK